MNDQNLISQRRQARAKRVDGYAKWLADDVAGLTDNINHAEGFAHSTAILAEAREVVALALSRIDRAIELDRANHATEIA